MSCPFFPSLMGEENLIDCSRSNSDLVVYIKPEDLEKLKHENSMWLGNHRYEVDWLLGWVVTQRLGLAGVRSPWSIRFFQTFAL